MFEPDIKQAFASLGIHDVKVSVSNRPDLADYMCDAAFGAAKALRRAPAVIAQEVAGMLSQDGYTASVTGGFVNIRLHDDTIIGGLVDFTPRHATGETFFIDSGGPNIAKPLHVGHLRSLVIGDALARILRYCGHRVIKDIHYGDWGYQMGLLLAAFDKIPTDPDDLETMYPQASARAKIDPEFKAAAQRAVVALQNDDPDTRARWEAICNLSKESVAIDLKTLGVDFDEWLGESDAHAMIPFIAHALTARGTLVESDGALVVHTTDGALMFRNSEGGYLYAATDIATIVQRDNKMPNHGTHTGLYVVDERQSLHFKQVFEVAQQFSPARLEHIAFGTVNGPDGKPFKTRNGGVPRLTDLMSEAIAKAAVRSPDNARDIAMAALKFGDLINRRTGSYPFDLDRALKFEGKTGPYMLYQIVRIKSIIRQREVMMGAIVITTDAERALALHMLQYIPVIEQAGRQRMPHLVAEYAYELSQLFARFYTDGTIKDNVSRLTLAGHALARLEILMQILGIQPVESM